MAIGYTEIDFINGSAPALNATNLNKIDEALKDACDQLDAQGVLTEAGRIDANAIAATAGADLAERLQTAANVEDGADVTDEANVTAIAVATDEVTAAPDHIWGLVGDALKRWTKAGFEAVVRAFSATTAAAGTVMLASTGIEAATKVPKATGAELAALLTAGGFSLSPAEGADNLDNIADGTTYKRILAAVATALNASTIVAGTQWGSGNDGNGGRPPSAKAQTTNGTLPGFMHNIYTTTTDKLEAGGTFLVDVVAYIEATGALDIGNGKTLAVMAGGTTLTAPAGDRLVGTAKRLTA